MSELCAAMALRCWQQLGNVRRWHWSSWMRTTRRVPCLRRYYDWRQRWRTTSASRATWHQNDATRKDHRRHKDDASTRHGGRADLRWNHTLHRRHCYFDYCPTYCAMFTCCHLSISLSRTACETTDALEQKASKITDEAIVAAATSSNDTNKWYTRSAATHQTTIANSERSQSIRI